MSDNLHFPVSPPVDRDALRRAVEDALPFALDRAHLMGQIRLALQEGKDAVALTLMRQYCGIPLAQVMKK